MAREPYYSRRGNALYRLNRLARGGLVAEQWVASAWQPVSNVYDVIYRTTPISAGAAAALMTLPGEPDVRPPGIPL